MSNLSLHEITNAFPMLMETEDMMEENKKQIEEELTVLLQQKKPKHNRIYTKFRANN